MYLFRTTKRILFGPGTIEKTGAEAKLLKARKALLVTDPGIGQAGLLEPVKASLNAAAVPFGLFEGVEPDPRIEIVARSVKAAKKEKADLIIGYGGGSSLDIAKVTSILLTNPAPLDPYFGVDLVPNPGVPVILIPTTAGTGSEVTPIAILSDTQEHLKKGIVSPYLFPETAILDPVLTLGLPPMVTAFTGMDALIHALEGFTSVNANDLTDHLALRAMDLLFGNLPAAFARGEDLAARTSMLEGSLLAGMAFANAGVTAVHAFAYPLGGEFHLPHGLANAVMLPYVLRFNLLGNLPKFARIAQALGIQRGDRGDRELALKGLEAIEQLMKDLTIPANLKVLKIPKKALPKLAEGVMKVTRLLANNPRRMTLKEALIIYEKAWEGELA
jgi:alcohol dehydrogenase